MFRGGEPAHAGGGRDETRLGSMRRAAIRKHSAPTKVPMLATRASSVTPFLVMKAASCRGAEGDRADHVGPRCQPFP